MRASVRCGENGRVSRGTPSAAVAWSCRAANCASPGASIPHQKTRGARGLGKNPRSRMRNDIEGARAAIRPARPSAPSSRVSGHSPMNLVVMCRFAGGSIGSRRWDAGSRATARGFEYLGFEFQAGEQSHERFHCICCEDGDYGIRSDSAARFLSAPHLEVARDLMGKVLVHGPAAGNHRGNRSLSGP